MAGASPAKARRRGSPWTGASSARKSGASLARRGRPPGGEIKDDRGGRDTGEGITITILIILVLPRFVNPLDNLTANLLCKFVQAMITITTSSFTPLHIKGLTAILTYITMNVSWVIDLVRSNGPESATARGTPTSRGTNVINVNALITYLITNISVTAMKIKETQP